MSKHFEARESHALSTTPSNPQAGNLKLYFKSDGNLYKLDEFGVEELVWGWGVQRYKDTIVGNGVDVTFTLSQVPQQPQGLLLFNSSGVRLREGAAYDYTISGAFVTFTFTPTAWEEFFALWTDWTTTLSQVNFIIVFDSTGTTTMNNNEYVKCRFIWGVTTINLPTAVGVSWMLVGITKDNSSSFPVMVETTWSETINWQPNGQINNQHTSVILISDWSNWNVA